MQDKSVASTAARIATAVMGGGASDTTPAAAVEKPKSDIEIARENMKKKMGKKGKKKDVSKKDVFKKEIEVKLGGICCYVTQFILVSKWSTPGFKLA